MPKLGFSSPHPIPKKNIKKKRRADKLTKKAKTNNKKSQITPI
jgi:hypothetical protein